MTTTQTELLLKNFALFQGLFDLEMEEIRSHSKVSTRAHRMILLAPEQCCDWVYLLLSGYAQGLVAGRGGANRVVRILGPGDLVGLVAALIGHGQTESVALLPPCQLLAMRRQEFSGWLKTMPALAANVLHQQSVKEDAGMEALQSQSSLGARARVAFHLLELARRIGTCGTDKRTVLPAPINRSMLASLAGVSRGETSRIFTEFSQRGHVQCEDKLLIIPQLATLERIIDLNP